MVVVEKRPGHYQRTAYFELKPTSGVRQASLAGSFNGWNVNTHIMRPNTRGNWEAAVHLPPGSFEFKYVVDQHQWVSDPESSETAPDGFGGSNSIVRIN